MTAIRRLTCSCCGADAGRWQQHPNRDTGFGVCAPCVERIAKRMTDRPHLFGPEDSIERLYGVEGINWGRGHAEPVQIARKEWSAIHPDYRGTDADGRKYAFAGCLPKGRTTESGTTLVYVRVEG